MKKISILFVSILSLSILSVSCDADFENVNKNPNRPEVVPAHLLLGNIIRINQNVMYGMQQGGDMGMCWSQQVSKVQYNDEERYIPRAGAIDGVWTTLYSSVLTSSQEMYKIADSEGNDNLKGISLVLQANAFQILTDLYGPIPFKEFNVPNNVKPAYDTQEEVYKGILKMLTDADALLASNTGNVPTTSDLVYQGDATKWRKLANSLHLKALMRISKVAGEIDVNVATEVQKLVAAGKLMTSNADSAQLNYLAAQPDANPIYETVVFGAREEYKVSSVMVDKLVASNDPRLGVFASPIDNAGNYAGNIPGTENSGNYDGFSALGDFYLDPTLPGVILSYAQVEFYLAEAANEGFLTGTSDLVAAADHYNKGITANMTFNGVGASAPAFLSEPDVLFSGTQADAKKKIGEQMWVSLFGQGFEAWTEWRRTGFPALTPVVNAAPGVTTIPSRLFYNTSEVTFNNASYNAGVVLLKGQDKLTTRLWWMK